LLVNLIFYLSVVYGFGGKVFYKGKNFYKKQEEKFWGTLPFIGYY